MAKHTLHKLERLKSQTTIDSLFKQGQSVFTFPLKVQYKFLEQQSISLQFGVSVPKKKFKKAVDRNKIKRLIRESYRTSNSSLKETLSVNSQNLALMVIYVGQKIPKHKQVDKAMKKLLGDLESKCHDPSVHS